MDLCACLCKKMEGIGATGFLPVTPAVLDVGSSTVLTLVTMLPSSPAFAGPTGVPYTCFYSGEMRDRTKLALLLAALLASVLFGAQLHCCLDLNSQTLDSHVCPICSAAGSAVVTSAVHVEMAPAVNRLEEFRILAVVPLIVPRSIAPRAPPSV